MFRRSRIGLLTCFRDNSDLFPIGPWNRCSRARLLDSATQQPRRSVLARGLLGSLIGAGLGAMAGATVGLLIGFPIGILVF